jgi:predicted hydrolase (HD superfamily)
MFTEKELWQIVGLVHNQDFYSERDFEFGLKVLAMLPDSDMKPYYEKSFRRHIEVIKENEIHDNDAEIYIAQHYMK